MSMTQIPLLTFHFTHYHEFISPHVQENIISIFRRNNSALHLRICQALIFIIAAIFLLYSLGRLKKKTKQKNKTKNLYLCSWNQGNFLTKRVSREWQKNKNFKDSLRWGGRYDKMGLYSRKNRVCP